MEVIVCVIGAGVAGLFMMAPRKAFGCLFCCLFLLSVILGFFAHNVSDRLAGICRIFVYLSILLIVVLTLIGTLFERFEKKKEAEERDRLEREKRERFAALKKELIESGLFYEDDPWDKLSDGDNYSG